ncbi:MAG: GTPase HflX [Bryobacterales bacterium]|nr:GTPase HflX [Bryobacterales bacterium]
MRRAEAVASVLDYTPEESLDELTSLAISAGAEVVERVVQSRPRMDAATLVGSGKVDELAALVRAYSAGVVLFDQELTPTQQRNLERALQAKVVDRTQLILDIFARRAHTREGQLQVELAQLNYLLPRLAGRGTEMSRLGAGIGTRGPGETQLETDRRRIFRRIRKIEGDLDSVRAGRSTQRQKRRSVPLATIALVGYTNAGKSTLFNRLTGAGVLADARMFATLDPTVRAIALPSNRRALLSDTVGFIRNLPTTLVRAFRATLEEVTEAALLLHVIDASSVHAAQQTQHVFEVLSDIGAGATAQIVVLNKADRLGGAVSNAAAAARRITGSDVSAPAVAVSATSGLGIPDLIATIDEALPGDPVSRALFRFPVSEGAGINYLYEHGRVTGREDTDDYCEITADVTAAVRQRLQRYLVPE